MRLVGESVPADEAGGEGEEVVVEVGAAFPAGGQTAELMQQRQGLFDDPAHGLVDAPGATTADQWTDPSLAQQMPVRLRSRSRQRGFRACAAVALAPARSPRPTAAVKLYLSWLCGSVMIVGDG